MKFVHNGGGIVVTEKEWDKLPNTVKGRIETECVPGGTRKHLVWNRTLRMAGRMFVEGLNLSIVP